MMIFCSRSSSRSRILLDLRLALLLGRFLLVLVAAVLLGRGEHLVLAGAEPVAVLDARRESCGRSSS